MRTGLVVVFLSVALAIPPNGQSPPASAAGALEVNPRFVIASQNAVSAPAILPSRLIRVIADPNLGNLWLLCRDLETPGGPGRLLQVAAGRPVPHGPLQGGVPSRDTQDSDRVIRLVIHAGDRVVVSENSAVVDARLSAVALESAIPGSGFNARLEIGGKVVRAIALGSGRASLAPEPGVRR